MTHEGAPESVRLGYGDNVLFGSIVRDWLKAFHDEPDKSEVVFIAFACGCHYSEGHWPRRFCRRHQVRVV